MRFLGSERGQAHEGWYRLVAEHYDDLHDPGRASKAYPFLHDILRRHAPVRDVIDFACGTFALDWPLLRRGYRVVGRDRSDAMLRVARALVRRSGRPADVARGDMRTARVPGTFDAVLCLGTAFNYLTIPVDIRAALRNFHRHLRPGGILVLDLTNFDAWIREPMNARAEMDIRTADGRRTTIFAYNDQELERRIHHARFLTLVERGGRVDVLWSEAPLRIWSKRELADELARSGFQSVEWWGDLRLGAKYSPRKSPRLVSVSRRTASLRSQGDTTGSPSRKAGSR